MILMYDVLTNGAVIADYNTSFPPASVTVLSDDSVITSLEGHELLRLPSCY